MCVCVFFFNNSFSSNSVTPLLFFILCTSETVGGLSRYLHRVFCIHDIIYMFVGACRISYLQIVNYWFISFRYTDAATFFLRLGVGADKCNAVNSQCKVVFLFWLYLYIFILVIISVIYLLKYMKLFILVQAYLSAIIVYLYAHDFGQAQTCYNDCSQ